MDKIISLKTPLRDEVIAELRSGDRVLISGVVYTARDAAHKRMVELIAAGRELPFDVQGQIIYYVGPTPPGPGRIIGSAGPTTSSRMDAYTPALLKAGLKGMIGKGSRGREVIESMKACGAVYFAATGGAGALISETIESVEIVAYEDLGTEAIRRMEVRDFPAIVINDIHGHDLYRQGVETYRQNPVQG
jgi:fumarate hydratase subunit beta